MKNCRIFVEKKEGFDLEAKRLCKEWKEALQLNSLTKVRILNCYDIFGAKDVEDAKKMIFSEVVTDFVSEDFDETIPHFAVEFLPGQLDRKSTRLNSSHANISYAVFCLKKKQYNLANTTR